jgi:ACR3 family arsenite transporter
MALLGWIFVGWLLRPWLPAEQIESYIAGLIILAAAPCTAMVFVWSNPSGGELNFTLSQVALNDTIMVFAFAPIVGLLLGLSSIVRGRSPSQNAGGRCALLVTDVERRTARAR